MIFRHAIQCLGVWLLLATPVLLPAAFALAFTANHLGTWMVISDTPPARLDYLFTYGGENAREVYASTLLSGHPEALWLCSDDRKGRKAALAQKGVDTSRVIMIDTCSSTHAETGYLADWLSGRAVPAFPDTLSVGLVSGPYHMRRIALEIWCHAERLNMRFFFLPVPFEYYNHTLKTYRQWWRDRRMRSLVLFELKKMLYTGFIHHRPCQ